MLDWFGFPNEHTSHKIEDTPNFDFFTSFRNLKLELSTILNCEGMRALSNFEKALFVLRTAHALKSVKLKIWLCSGKLFNDDVEYRKATIELTKCRMIMLRERRESGLSKAQFEVEFGFRVVNILRQMMLNK